MKMTSRGVERGEEGGQVARPLDDGAGGGLDGDAQLGRRSRGRGDVLPTPGGPKSRTWSRASPRLRGRLDGAPGGCAITWGWPTYSSRARGRERLVEAGVVVGGAGGDEPRIGSVHRAPGHDLQGAPQEVLEPAAAVVAQRRSTPRSASARE